MGGISGIIGSVQMHPVWGGFWSVEKAVRYEAMGFVTRKSRLAYGVFEFWIYHPLVARRARPGQFVIVRTTDRGERIPLTIVETSDDAFRIVVKAVGKSTYQLCAINPGERLSDVVGPLGKPSEIKFYGDVLVVGGGVGIAAILPIAKALKEAGNSVTVVIGARSAEELILKDEFAFADELRVATDDGSAGMKGTVIDAMASALMERKFDIAWAVGPAAMMKFASLKAAEFDLPIWVSLNSIMVDGTGMCGGCRVTIKGESGHRIEYTCVDGPEFDGRFVDWDVFISRLNQYRTQEEIALKTYLAEVGEPTWL